MPAATQIWVLNPEVLMVACMSFDALAQLLPSPNPDAVGLTYLMVWAWIIFIAETKNKATTMLLVF